MGNETFERPFSLPDAERPTDGYDKKTERTRSGWSEHPVLVGYAREDVGGVIRELQREDPSVFKRLPLSAPVMNGLVRMYLEGIESGRPPEDLQDEVISVVQANDS
jgi:hypothetical protein